MRRCASEYRSQFWMERASRGCSLDAVLVRTGGYPVALSMATSFPFGDRAPWRLSRGIDFSWAPGLLPTRLPVYTGDPSVRWKQRSTAAVSGAAAAVAEARDGEACIGSAARGAWATHGLVRGLQWGTWRDPDPWRRIARIHGGGSWPGIHADRAIQGVATGMARSGRQKKSRKGT